MLALQDQTFKLKLEETREAVFNQEFIEKTYKQMAGVKGLPSKYLDNGAGALSKRLEYKDWFEFNNAQRVRCNSVEHLAWLMPLVIVGGVFQPRITVGLAGTILIGREFYRFGYLTKEGASSKIREMGAIPLNIAEVLMMASLGLVYLRYKTGAFFLRRKFVKRLTWTSYDTRLIEVEKEAEDAL